MGGMSLLHTHFLHLQIYFGKQTKKDAWHVVKLYECIFSPHFPHLLANSIKIAQFVL